MNTISVKSDKALLIAIVAISSDEPCKDWTIIDKREKLCGTTSPADSTASD